MGKKRTAFIVLLILILVIISMSYVKIVKAVSRTIVVPNDYSRIQDAIDNAVEGDTIFLKSGVYDEILKIIEERADEEELIILRKKEGCNKAICFKDGILTHARVGSRAWQNWNITVLPE